MFVLDVPLFSEANRDTLANTSSVVAGGSDVEFGDFVWSHWNGHWNGEIDAVVDVVPCDGIRQAVGVVEVEDVGVFFQVSGDVWLGLVNARIENKDRRIGGMGFT